MKTIFIILVAMFAGLLSQAGQIDLVPMRCSQNRPELGSIRQVCMSKNRSDHSRWVVVYHRTATLLYNSEGFLAGGPTAPGHSIERYRYYGDLSSNFITRLPFPSNQAPYTDITFIVGKYRSLSGTFAGIQYSTPWMEIVQSRSGIPID